MNIIRKRSWELPEREATPEAVFFNRRSVLAGLGIAGASIAGGAGSLGPPAAGDAVTPGAGGARSRGPHGPFNRT